MKKDISLNEGLNKFSGVAVSVLNTNIGSITGDSPNVALASAFTADAADVTADFDRAVLISAHEGTNDAEAGIIFTTQDITMLADLMLMGDGAAADTLDDDLKDAVSEMMNQFFGGLTVPVNTELGQKVQFKVSAVNQLPSPAALSAKEYTCFNFTGTIKNKNISFRLYIADTLAGLFSGKEEEASVIGTDFFGGSSDDHAPAAAPSSAHHGSSSPNMEMLLDIDIPISVRMGTAKLFLKDILGLGPGNIVELEQNADEMVELTVNNQLIARGEIVIVDGYFGFRIKEIISKAERIKRLKD